MRDNEFILVCGNCGEKIVLIDRLSDEIISEKFSIIPGDDGTVCIICNCCGNKITF